MAAGDLVGSFSVPGEPLNVVYQLTSNPGGFFAISGTTLVQAINTPNGTYPIVITALAPGVSITTPFSLVFGGELSDPIPIIF
jgi:hypothetical protein